MRRLGITSLVSGKMSEKVVGMYATRAAMCSPSNIKKTQAQAEFVKWG